MPPTPPAYLRAGVLAAICIVSPYAPLHAADLLKR